MTKLKSTYTKCRGRLYSSCKIVKIVTGGLMNVCKEIEFKLFMALPDKVFISRLIPSKYRSCRCSRCDKAKQVSLLLTFGDTMCSYRVCMTVAREIRIRYGE